MDFNDGTWLTKSEAAILLRVKPRQLERRAEQGYVQKQTADKKPWQKTATVYYSRGDIEALLRGKPNSYPVLMGTKRAEEQQTVAGASTEIAVTRPPIEAPAAVSLWRDIAGHLAGLGVESRAKPWLGLGEAAEFSGLPIRYLRERAEAGAPFAVNIGVKRKRWMFNREMLKGGC